MFNYFEGAFPYGNVFVVFGRSLNGYGFVEGTAVDHLCSFCSFGPVCKLACVQRYKAVKGAAVNRHAFGIISIIQGMGILI